MTGKNLLINAVLGAVILCGSVTLAQDPVINVAQSLHPNLFHAQSLVVEADKYIRAAQKDNRYDLHGHAQQARQLLAQANQELKLAAEDANAAKK